MLNEYEMKRATKPAEYVIYCRKSTDESSGMQNQSLPDQVKYCLEYARRNDIKLKFRDDDYDFDSEEEIEKQLQDDDPVNRNTYVEAQKYYVINEQKSAKTPGLREKRRKLIKYIKKGKIKGVLSYSPDRQARNMLEGGEIIDLVDKKLVDLKYTNFLFENTPDGKMMLGIWFVFSKQYSDKLSQDSSRGTYSALERGRALGVYKHGYFINDQGFHEPHEINFGLIRQAFHFKIYKNKSDSFIASRLNKHGYKKDTKKGSKEITSGALSCLRTDSFYYGLFIYGNGETDLRDSSSYYKPIITEQEYDILLNKSTLLKKPRGEKKLKEKTLSFMPLRLGLVKTKDNYSMSCYLPNPKRFEKKLAKEKIKNSRIKFEDIVKPHQIKYRCTTSESKYKNLEIGYDLIEEQILNLFKSFKFDKTIYEEYLTKKRAELFELNKSNSMKKRSLQLQCNRLEAQKKKYIRDNLGKRNNFEEEKIYQKEKIDFDAKINFIKSQIDEIEFKENDDMSTFERFISFLKNTYKQNENLNYVRGANLSKILFSNIVITPEKDIIIEVIDELKPLFKSSLLPTRIELVSTP